MFLSNWKPNSTYNLLSSQSPMLSDCHAHLHHVFPVFRKPKRTIDATMSTTFVCLENPYEVPIFTLCWSTFQIVELAPSLPSIKLPFNGHVLGSLDVDNHINPKFNKTLHGVCNFINQGQTLRHPFFSLQMH